MIPPSLVMTGFDSILVRLKANRSVFVSTAIVRFDSILVRLKVWSAWRRWWWTPKFRFHTGSIKSIVWWQMMHAVWKFRFHTGSIKRLRFNSYTPMSQPSFDSILVRLKAKLSAQTDGSSEMFRFHTGSIKRQTHTALAEKWNTFRFHTGSIKSGAWNYKRAVEVKFRFHTGSIKRLTRKANANGFSRFDSILVRLKGYHRHTFGYLERLFRFHTGSIKRHVPRRQRFNIKLVSIPYWFD